MHLTCIPKLKYYFTFLLLSLLLVTFKPPVFSQTESSEPIKLAATATYFEQMMSITQASSRQIDSIIQLSIAYSYVNEDTCLILGRRAVALGKQQEDEAIYAKALLELGDSYRIFSNLEAAEELILKSKSIYERLSDQGQLAHVNNKLGALMSNRGDNEASINFYLEALAAWELLKDSQNIVKPLINIGATFQRTARLGKAAEYYEKAMYVAKRIKDPRAIFYILNNQGIVYQNRATLFKGKADSILNNKEIYLDSMLIYADKAITVLNQSLEMSKQNNDKRNIIMVLGNLTDVYSLKEEHKKALEFNKEAETLSADLRDVMTQISIRVRMARIYRELGQFPQSIAYGKAAQKLAKDNGIVRRQSFAEQELYETYKALGQFEKALSYLESSKTYNDQNVALDRNKAIAEIETKYQTVKKEKQLLEQKNNIMMLETKNAKIKKQRNYLILGTFLLGIFVYFGFYINKIRKQRNDKIAFAEALIYAQEEERKRIARDLHDGVGQSLLLIKKQLASTQDITLENQQLITDTLEEVRSISRDLHPFQLEKFGLTVAINEVLNKIEKSTDLFISKEIDNIDDLLDDKSEINLFRTIQEALSNVVKHAEATAAKVSLQKLSKELVITIQDNGKGFDHELAVVTSKSLGLRTMYERIASIGGKLKIEKGHPKGTMIRIQVPV